MKTFEDLKFTTDERGVYAATAYFDNGYGVFLWNNWGHDPKYHPYAILILKDGRACSDAPITDSSLLCNSIAQVNDVMKRVQEL